MPALGFIEIPFFSIAAVVADEVAKASGVRILGFDTSGSEEIVIRAAGGVYEIAAALEAATACAAKLGVKSIGTRLAKPDSSTVSTPELTPSTRSMADATRFYPPISPHPTHP